MKNIVNDKRVIGARSLSAIFAWIYAACAVHERIISHRGGAILMGYGIINGEA